ncbi:uncharacterized protein LOC116260062 [Nymphaea colorata]|uniref:Legume lectin domain-containing protein n=1 Tax=Nymphaea colorata TaxID=210225 RepID=A0A5K1GYM4_9MAGN|nr:uncharacterized protein LOC116260062 [Nymphaea colorata]
MAFLLLTSLLLLFIPSPTPAKADFATARSLDALLQTYTFDLFRQRAKTGVVYTADLPGNLSGVEAHGIRFRSGSLRRRGASPMEFDFPVGTVVQPYVTRLIVVLQNLGNRSADYYDYYPAGFRLVTPVLGFLAYDAAGSSNPASQKELDMVATGSAITINFTSTIRSGDDGNALCVFFDVNGTVALGNQTARNVCKSSRQGHFALVTKESPSPPPPSQPPGAAPGRGKKSGKWKVVVGALVGGVVGAVLLVLLVAAIIRMQKKSKIARMERRAGEEEAFGTATVGQARMPIASAMRTAPAIENDYRPGD